MSSNKKDNSVSKPLAPEEVAVGMFVTVHEAILEVPSFFWCSDAAILPPHEMVRLPFKPADAGRPYKVKAICLPYVFATAYNRRVRVFDLRRQRLVRLGEAYARRIREALRKRARTSRPDDVLGAMPGT